MPLSYSPGGVLECSWLYSILLGNIYISASVVVLPDGLMSIVVVFAAAHHIAAAGVEDFLVVVSVAWAPRAADPSIYPLIAAIDMFPSQKVVDFELI